MVDRDDQGQGVKDGATEPARRGIVAGLSRAGLWLVSPYIFSKKNMNPVGDLSQPLKASAAMKDRKPFRDLREVLDDNPEFEAVRERAIKNLTMRLYFAVFAAVVWVIVAYFTDIANLFPFPFMNTSLKSLYTLVVFGMVFVTDFQLVVFKYRVVGLTFWRYVRFRLGGK